MDEKQSLWLSGYLAARANNKKITSERLPSHEVLIAHGGETGNSKKLAYLVEQRVLRQGLRTKIQDLSLFKARQLDKHELVIIICSTHGDGDPPEPILPFYLSLMSSEKPLESMRYAVLALGDTSYDHFCATGIEIDEKLESLGARRLLERQDCDVNFERTANLWMERLVKCLPAQQKGFIQDKASSSTIVSNLYSKSSPATVTVLENLKLSSSDRTDPIHHITLSLADLRLDIEAGDAIGILVKNPADLIENILGATGLCGSQQVSVNGKLITLYEALSEKLDITIPSRDFAQLWESLDTTGEFHKTMGATEKEKKDFLRSSQLSDHIKKYKVAVNAQQFVDILRPLQPRLYDVANSLKVLPDEIHLCVKRYFYTQGKSTLKGIGSNFLIDQSPGNQIQIFPHKHARFNLPISKDVPLILVADGTGVAPFRAFMQEIETGERIHPCWLIFSEQNFEEDFLYQSEWLQAFSSGALKRLTPVFYEDEKGATLISSLLQEEDQLKQWMAKGAHLYLSGDKALLNATEHALQEWASLQSNINWAEICDQKRVHRNVY